MKTIGIIGGLGPESTGDYYREIISQLKERLGKHTLHIPEIIIYSVNMGVLIDYFDIKNYPPATDYLVTCVNKLQLAGANFVAISANTPHLLFPDIQKKASIPMISIVESCRNKARQMGLKRCGLLGTRFTMQASFYADSFKESGIEIIIPDAPAINRIHELLFTELEHGIFKDETRNELLEMVEVLKKNYSIDSLILGCTEFPIMFTSNSYLGIPFLNTTRIHVEAIVNESLS